MDKISKSIFFFLGVIITLFIFGFNLPILKQFRIVYTLQGSQAEWLAAIGTLSATVIALTIAIWGERLKNWGDYKPKIVLVDKFENIQENEQHQKQGHTRLLFENKGRGTAEEVEAYVTKIYDGNQERRNFLPVPLSWTHDGRSVRNFHVNQFRHLDFCRRDNIEDKKSVPNLLLVAGGGTLNASFMAENLIDEIYLDVEPVVFGKGIRLFAESDFEAKLKLLETKKLSDNEIQFHYQVLK